MYVGILTNRGKLLETDADALAYAFDACGIEPADDWYTVDEEFRQMFLEWFFSGDWICCDDEQDAYERYYYG